MRDSVAEVLAERATLDNGAAAGLALSVALHAGITAAAIYAAIHHSAPEMTNVLSIHFAPAQAAAPPLTVPAAQPPAPPAAPKQEAKPKTPPPIPHPEPPKPVEQPVVKNTAPPDPFGRSNKKPGAAPPATAPHPLATPVPATPQPTHAPAVPGVANPDDITAGTSGVTGLEGGDFPYTLYIDRMKSLIGTHWFRPQGTTAVATVHFVINRDGTIRDIALDTSSGNGVFDRAAQRAVVEASPLPPLPFAYSGTYLGVHLTFR